MAIRSVWAMQLPHMDCSFKALSWPPKANHAAGMPLRTGDLAQTRPKSLTPEYVSMHYRVYASESVEDPVWMVDEKYARLNDDDRSYTVDQEIKSGADMGR